MLDIFTINCFGSWLDEKKNNKSNLNHSKKGSFLGWKKIKTLRNGIAMSLRNKMKPVDTFPMAHSKPTCKTANKKNLSSQEKYDWNTNHLYLASHWMNENIQIKTKTVIWAGSRLAERHSVLLAHLHDAVLLQSSCNNCKTRASIIQIRGDWLGRIKTKKLLET